MQNTFKIINDRIDQYNFSDHTTIEAVKAREVILKDIAILGPLDQDLFIEKIKKRFGITKSAIKAELKTFTSVKPAHNSVKLTSDELKSLGEPHEEDKPIVFITMPDGTPYDQGILSKIALDNLVEVNNQAPTIFYDGTWREIKLGSSALTPVSAMRLRSILGELFYWRKRKIKVDGDIKEEIQTPVNVPQVTFEDIYHHSDLAIVLPKIELLVNRPIIDRDGNILYKKGYYPDNKTYILNDFQLTTLFDSVEQAKEILFEPFKHFEFKEPRDRACAWAYFFTLLIREHIDGNTPLFYFGSTRPGVGKGLLANSLHAIVSGEENVPMATWYVNDIEFARSLNGAFIGGRNAINLDNLPDGREMTSPYLERLVTAGVVNVKILYQDNEAYLPVKTVISMTGVNNTFSHGLVRRIQSCILTTDVENPEEKEFPNLEKDINSNRNKYLEAALYIVSEWYKQGKPRSDITYGSFSHWAQTIGGILNFIGVDGFMDKPSGVSDISVRAVAEKEFVYQMYQAFESKPWGVKEAYPIAILGTATEDDNATEWDGVLLEHIYSRDIKKGLGHILKTIAGRTYEFNAVALRLQRGQRKSPANYEVVVTRGDGSTVPRQSADSDVPEEPLLDDSEIGF